MSGDTDTLGTRLARTALKLARRRAPRPAWLAGLERVLERMAKRDRPVEARYERREAPPPPLRLGPDEGAGEPLPGDVRLALRRVAGPAADVTRTHTSELADRVAGASRADAVTVGRDVFFRRGRLAPRTDAGGALLVHELTHVSASLQAGAAARRETAAGVRVEEARAQQREHAYLDRLRPAPTTPASPPPPLAPTAAPQPGAVASRPMTAPEDRPLAPERPPDAPALDVAQLQRTLYQGLRAELRAELERGG